MASTTFWDKQAKNFSKDNNSDLISIISRLDAYIKPSYNVIDLGCGTAQGTLAIAKQATNIVGLDLSKEMIHYAREAANEQELSNVSFEVCSIDSYSTQGNVDLITSFNLLHLINDLDGMLKSIYEQLNEGGYYISYTPCMAKAGILASIIKFISKLKIFPDITSFTTDVLQEKISSNGFKILSAEIDYEQVPQILIVAQKE